MAPPGMQRLLLRTSSLFRIPKLAESSSASIPSKPSSSEHVIRSKQPDIKFRSDQTLTEFLWDRVQDWGDAPYMECGVSGRKYTFAELYRYSRGLSTALSKLGVEPNEVVGVVMQNLPEYPIAIFGCLDIGAIASPVNPGYTPTEIKRQLAYSEASYVICSDLYAQSVIDAVKEEGAKSRIKHVIVIGDETPSGCLSFFSLMKTIPAISIYLSGVKNNEDQLALLPFSSGTTGPPKGVMQSHANLIANVLQFNQPEVCQLDTLGSGKQDRLLGVLPMFHCYGSTVFLLCSTYKGAHVLTLPKFAPPTYVGAIKAFKPTIIHFVTPLINFMVHSEQIQTQDLASLKGVVAGAAPIGSELIQMFLKKVGRPIFFQEAYGMTEFSPLTHIIPLSTWNSKPSSCGILIASTNCKIVDTDTGEVVGPNQRGELWIRGPQAMKGYYKNQKATDETIDSEGWVKTGDIGYYDEDDHFYIVDRLKELIKVKGFQVAPSELEGILRDHPKVADVAVIGVPDQESGEVPRAYVVKADHGLKDTDIHKYLAGKLAPFKQLKGGVEFVEVIPKSPAGKILRRELVAAYKAKL